MGGAEGSSSSLNTTIELLLAVLPFPFFATSADPPSSSSRNTAIEPLLAVRVLFATAGGAGAGSSSSRKIEIELLLAVRDFSFFVGGTGGGGIDVNAPDASSGPGSRNTVIFEADGAREDLPARIVVPAALLTSTVFSLMRDLRVPISGHGVGFVAWFGSFSASPEGSTNTGIRPFGRGGAGAENTSSEIEGVRPDVERVVRERDDEDTGGSPSTLRFEALAEDTGTTSGSASEDWGSEGDAIIRFWNSRCLASSRSSGAARLAMPRRYVSSASTRLSPS